jgi:DNA-binding MarR family transcriptional regulator
VARSEATARQKADPAPEPQIEYGELNNHLGYFLRRAQYWIFKDVNTRLAHLRLDVIRYSILEMVSVNTGISQKLISETLGIERARLVALLDELQKMRYLLRKRSEQDRRSQELYLTRQGITVLKEANALIAQHEEKLISRIGADHYPVLLKALSGFRMG